MKFQIGHENADLQKYSFRVWNNYFGWKLLFSIEANLGTKNKIGHKNTVWKNIIERMRLDLGWSTF